MLVIQLFHNILTDEYYKNAVRIMKEKINNPKFFIFSDDVEWCEKNMNYIENTVFIKNTNTELTELYLMKKCKNSIIANSSFSWWGAWLGSKENVIAPKKWLMENNDNRKWACENWIEL